MNYTKEQITKAIEKLEDLKSKVENFRNQDKLDMLYKMLTIKI